MSVTQTFSRYPAPLWLSHRPIWLLPYESFDGLSADNTDCKYLSVGAAQYNEDCLSAKTLRYTDRWSRMSEELPLQRVVDLTLWLALTLFSPSAGPTNVRVAPGTFQGQDDEYTATYIPQTPGCEKRQEALEHFLNGKGETGSEYELVKERLTKLKETLIRLEL